MTDQVITREMIEAKATAAFEIGHTMNPMPPGSGAWHTWNDTIKRLERQRAHMQAIDKRAA